MDFLIHHLLRASAERLADKHACVHGDARLSYAEFQRRAAGLAAGLQQAGVGRGDRIGIYLDHSLPLCVTIFGVSTAGGVFVPINNHLFPDQVAHIVRDCGMKGLILPATKAASLAAALGDVPALHFLVVEGGAGVPPLPRPVLRFEDLCAAEPPAAGRDLAIGRDLAAILYTSGSTGKPKGVMLSHEQLLAGSRIVSSYLEIAESERILSLLPFSFDAGLNQLMISVQQGATLVLATFVFAREIVELLLRERITALAGVPTLWSVLAQPNSPLHPHAFPDLRIITNTGGRLPEPVLRSLRAALPGARIYLMYGLTEAFRSTYLPPEELDRRPGSIGKAIPDTEILVVNERGEACRPGEVGELVHRGPTVSMGYWGQPELTARVLRPHPWLPPELCSGEKVCYSGDLVRADEDGFLYFVGRRDNLIKSSGFRISPTEVEEVLFQSGRLREAAVIGVPDEILGQAIKAFVVPHDGAAADPEGLLAFCATKLPRFMVPKQVEALEALPKTPSGKIDYPALRRREGLP